MKRGNDIFYGTLLLTLADLLLRLVSMGFQVYLSDRIGPGGIGLMQLIASVAGLALTIGAAGSRAASLYLTAGALGRGQGSGAILTGCVRYVLLFCLPTAVGLWQLAPWLAEDWIGAAAAVPSLRLYALTLPVGCLNGVLIGHLTAIGRVRSLVAVEFLEQGCAMAVTCLLLAGWAGGEMGRACLAVTAGRTAAALAAHLAFLRLTRPAPARERPPYGPILRTALPLGLAGVLRSGLGTLEHLLIPKGLARFSGTADPMADYGVLHGMVFPLLMLPAALLSALAELLTPELSRRAAGGRPRGVRHLVRRGMKMALLFGLACAGGLFLLADSLGEGLYHTAAAGAYLRLYAPFVPLLYLDSVIDAMNRGLGQQNANARYNLLTSALDIALLWYLLPRYGLGGYYASFALTHLVNLCLSLGRLVKVSGVGELPWRAAPCTILAAFLAMFLPGAAPPVLCYLLLLALLWALLGVVDREDLGWLWSLIAGP